MSDENRISALLLERIRDIQQSRGLSAAALARQSGIQKDRMYRLLDGQPLTVDDVWSIAAGLQMSPADLLPLDAVSSLPEDEARLLQAVRTGDREAVGAALRTLGVNPADPAPGAVAAARELRTSAQTIRAAADGIERAARSLDGGERSGTDE